MGGEFEMRLVAFGCSLSRQGSNNVEIPDYYDLDSQYSGGLIHQTTKLLKSEGVTEYINYSLSSSGIGEQVRRFHEYMAIEYKPDDIISWQITNIYRNTIDTALYDDGSDTDENNRKKVAGKYLVELNKEPSYYVREPNIDYIVKEPYWNLKGEKYITFLSHSKVALDLIGEMMMYTGERTLMDMFGCLNTIKLLNNPLVCWIGWKDACHGYEFIIRNELSKRNITVLAPTYLEWIKERGLPTSDTLHPSPLLSAPHFAKDVLVPEFKKLLKIKASQ